MKKDRIYLSSNWLSYFDLPIGKKYINESSINTFEKDLENYLQNNSKIVCLSSGTSSIHLALILSGININDEVLCQTFTFVASINPVLYLGAKPIFIDSEKDTWNMCPVSLEKAIKTKIAEDKKPKAILFVHLYGMPAKIDEIVEIAKKYKIPLIEDSAEALGSSYKGQKCGTFADFGILSFNNNKIITTSGGGALVCQTKKIKNKAIFLATQARDDAPHYQHSQIGYNYRMSNILAGIGSKQMRILDKSLALRRMNNKFYQILFKEIAGISVFVEPNKDYYSNYWLSCIVIDSKVTGFTREELRLQLEKDNIESRPLWKPMHLQPLFKNCDYYGERVAETLFENGLCLPSGSNLTDADRERIANSINKLV